MEGFKDFYGQTNIHPLAMTTVLVLGVMLIMAPRQYAILPMIILACFIPTAQRIVIIAADFDLLRILVVFGWVRILLKNEYKGLIWNRVDTMMVSWMVCGSIIYTLNYGTTGAMLNRSGWMFDGLGMYFLFRCVIREWRDLERVATSFILVSIPVSIAFFLEWSSGRNAFSMFGGVPTMTPIREGALRCQGAYSHPIMAGCFWAAVIPYMIATLAKPNKLPGAIGIMAAVFIVMTTNSSTPLMGVIFVAIGTSLWIFRREVKTVRWSFFGLLFVLHFVMNGPVWSLLARANIIGGSTGWHRYKIVDATINNFSRWAVFGEANPMGWGVWEMRDITNQFVLEALRGGLLTLVLFIAVISCAFGQGGRALKRRDITESQRFLIWCIGVGMFVHVGSFFGVSYFGQITMLIYLNLAMLASLPTVLQNYQPVLAARYARQAYRMGVQGGPRGEIAFRA